MANLAWPTRASGRGARSGERGQASAEYALFTLLLLAGAGLGLGGFVPTILGAYEHYLGGFWLLLGLPFP